jgi:putative glutamine amidotransferase
MAIGCSKRPLILVSADVQSRGKEFGDLSVSLSARYFMALERAGGLAVAMPPTVSREVIAETVRRCDGVLLTGGDDVDHRLYCGRLPKRTRETVRVTPDGGQRDLRELLLIDQVFRQSKPLLAICRGHQILNVALGGTLYADLPSQRPGPINHRRLDKRCEIVHEVQLTPDSVLSKITGKQKLGVNSTHHQAVAQVAPPLCVTAVSSDGIVEGLELKAGLGALPFLLSVQFHPERLVEQHLEHAVVFDAFTQACAAAK